MMKAILKGFSVVVVGSLLLQTVGCGQSPVRNPFAGRQEPKVGDLPELSQVRMAPEASIAWTNSTLSKQEYFTKLRPFINDQTLYGADHSGKVVALDIQNGKKLWSVNTGRKWIAGPTLCNNQLLLTTKDAMVVALDPNNGHTLWESKVSSEVLAPPSGEKGIVLVHAIDGSVTALEAKNGKSLWRVDQSSVPSLTLRYSSSPVVSGNTVLVGFATGKLQALDINSGLMEWERSITQPRGRSELQRMVDISADPIIVGNTVFAINYQGKLAAVNVQSGNLLWERELSSYQNIAADHHYVYVTDTAHNLWAIEQETGKTSWKQDALHDRYITGPAVVKGNVVVADRGGYLHFVDSRDGHLLNRLNVKGKYYQEPVSHANGVWVHAQNGKIAAVQLKDGSTG